MALKPFLLEMGTGIDLHGQDYTEAARRAVWDALHRSSLLFLRAVGLPDPGRMVVDVTIGIPNPEAVSREEVLKTLPYGRGVVTVVPGGLEIAASEGSTDKTVMANAAVIVKLDLD